MGATHDKKEGAATTARATDINREKAKGNISKRSHQHKQYEQEREPPQATSQRKGQPPQPEQPKETKRKQKQTEARGAISTSNKQGKGPTTSNKQGNERRRTIQSILLWFFFNEIDTKKGDTSHRGRVQHAHTYMFDFWCIYHTGV
jgi:hypothetical protein